MVELLKKTEVSSGVMNAMVCIVEKMLCRVYLVSLEQCIDAGFCARTQFLTAMRPQGIDSLTGVESTGADAGRTETAYLNLFYIYLRFALDKRDLMLMLYVEQERGENPKQRSRGDYYG